MAIDVEKYPVDGDRLLGTQFKNYVPTSIISSTNIQSVNRSFLCSIIASDGLAPSMALDVLSDVDTGDPELLASDEFSWRYDWVYSTLLWK